MHDRAPDDEAEECRRKALSYLGQPEATFLLRLAREFDRLALEQRLAAFNEQLRPGLSAPSRARQAAPMLAGNGSRNFSAVD